MDRLDARDNSTELVNQQTATQLQQLLNNNNQNTSEFNEALSNLVFGNFELAYNQYKRIESNFLPGEDPTPVTEGIFICLENIDNLFLVESLPRLRQDIMRYRLQSHVDGPKIRALCLRLIHMKYNSPEGAFTLQQIADDDFLMDCLANEYFGDPAIEKFLTDIRRQLLLNGSRELAINETYLPLYQALALQGYLTDYAFYCQHDETQLVDSLNEQLTNQLAVEECCLDDISVILLLLSMYMRLIDSKAQAALQGIATEQFPEYLQSIFDLTYLEPLDIEKKAAEVVTLGTINRDSLQVQQQYEETPYPRYTRLAYLQEPVSYREINPHLNDSDLNLDVLSQTPLEILVAGCGTGNQPLQIAKSCKNAKVTAVDINSKSLAFAERLKAVYSINNVQFFQADILELAKIFNARRERFQVVECVGVLHHLKNMEQGLAALNQLLVPGGVLHLGLYSKLGRANIAQIRELNATIGMQPSDSNIRQFRRKFISSKLDQSQQAILSLRDFYNTNCCRDLLFHARESCLTIPQIQNLLDQQGLQFLGFYFFSAEPVQQYKKMFPLDTKQRNLDYWHQFEQRYPDTFRLMYRFHCQKPHK